MNPELPTDPRQALEASLTAMLLGELPPEQVEFLERVLANDAGLRATHERLKQTLGFIREAEQSPASPQPVATEPLKLSDTRRTQLLQHFKTVRPKELAPKPRRKVSVVIAIAAVLVLTALLAAMLLPALARSKSRSMHFATATTPLSGHPSSDEAVVVIGGKAHNIDARRLALKPGPELGNGVPYVDRADSTIILPKGDEVQNGAAPESQVALGFAPQSEAHKQVLVEARLSPALAPLAQSDSFAVQPTVPPDQPREAGAVNHQDFDKDGLFLNYAIPPQQNSARANVEQSSGRRLQEGLRNSAESITAPLPSSTPSAPAAAPASSLAQSAAEQMARFRARYGLAGGTAGYGGSPSTKSTASQKGELEQRDKSKTSSEVVTGLPRMETETAVNEAVTRQANRIALRQKVSDALGAQGRHDLPTAAKLYDDANELAQKIGDVNVVPEADQARAGASAVRLEMARSEQDQKPAASRRNKGGEEELGRVPILGDKPSIGRAFGEQPSKGVEFVPQAQSASTGLNIKLTGITDDIAGKRLLARTDINGLEAKTQVAEPQSSATQQPAEISKALQEDGKLLFGMGKLDEAKKTLQQAVKQDPQNQSAYYYLNLINEQEYKKAELARDADSRERLVDVEKAWAKPKRGGPDSSLGVNAAPRGFFDDNLGKPKQLAAEPKAVRMLKVDRSKFEQGLEAVTGFDFGAIASAKDPTSIGTLTGGLTGGGGIGGGLLTVPRVNVAGGTIATRGTGGAGAGGLSAVTRTNSTAFVQTMARQFFQTMGIDLSPPNSLFYNDQEGTLIVRASPGELDQIQQAISVLDTDTPGNATNLQSKLQAAVSSEPPVNAYSRTNLIFTSGAQSRLRSKLDNIRLDSVGFDGLPLTDVIKILNDEAQRRDPEKKGINFLINQNAPEAAAQPVTIDPATGLPLPLASPQPTELSQVLVKIVPPLRDVSLADALDAIAKVADAPIQFSVEDYAVVCSPKPRNSTDLAELKIDLGKLPTNTTTNQQADVAAPKPVTPPSTPQPEIETAENAFSTFSLNVSDVSFKLAAASLEKGALPDPAGIRSEEFINAFDYHDPEPPAGMPVGFAYDRARYPFAVNRDLLRFSIKTAAQGREESTPLNLVILLDNSGSMERADRVQIIREALHVLAGQLHAQDKVSLVTFARTAQLRADGVSGTQATNVADEASELTPQGGTNLEEAMNLAYQTARKHYLPNGINRVVLLTDGAANLGDVEPENLKKKVEDYRKQGIALDCFGIGWEGYNDDLLEVLSRNGDGRYGFINTPEEASTEFVSQLAGALHVAASDVKVQVEFNPDRVANWRQIGYAKHQLTKEQFRDNTVDAAELGAAESGNALYVVETRPNGQGPVATVRVRYKVPGTTDYHEHEWPVPYTGNATSLEQAAPTIRLAAVASGFSEWLATNAFAADITLDSLLGYLRGIPETYAADPRPQKLEWMLRQAKSLSGK